MASKQSSNQKGSLVKRLGYSTVIFFVVSGILSHLLQTSVPAIILFENILNYFQDFKEFNNETNRFLRNNFAPVDKENINVPMNIISGKIPSELSGLYMHVGPNQIPRHIGSKRYHLFDGHGMIHSVRIASTSAHYSNQWVPTPRYSFEQKKDIPYFTLFGELIGIVGILKAIFIMPMKITLAGLTKITAGPANTALLYHNKKIYALHEGSLPFAIEWVGDGSIRGAGFETFNSSFSCEFTAHPKVDPIDNKVYFNGYDMSGSRNKTYYTHGSLAGPTLVKHFDIKSFSVPAISHDMAITQNYVIFLENSLQLTPEGLVKGKIFQMNESHHLRLGILPKNAEYDETIWFTTDKPYVIFHTMNAWEEINKISGEKEVILWACVSEVWEDSLEAPLPFHLAEFRVELNTGKVTTTFIPDLIGDFPRIHPNFVGQPSQIGFSGYYHKDNIGHPGGFFYGFTKIDLFSKKVLSKISHGDGRYSSECVLIPKSTSRNGSKTDDVYIATFVYDSHTKTSEWVVYDGTTMSSEPVLRLEVPARVPFGFHGEWFNEIKLQAHMASFPRII